MSQITPEPKKDEGGYVAFGIAIALGLLVMKDTIPLLLLLVGGLGAWRFWKRYQKKQLDKLTHLNQVFYRLVQENDGWITPLDLAMNSQVQAEDVREYLDRKATEFSAHFEVTDQGGIVYYFSTAQAVISSSEFEEIQFLQNQTVNSTPIASQPPEKPQPEPTKKNEVSLFPIPPSIQAEIPENLNQLELAKRLNVHPSTLSKWKTKPQFTDWCCQKDPDNITWKFSNQTKRFYPVYQKNIQSQGNPFLNQNTVKTNYKNRQVN
ncbi:helix-turn-helix domain-containing protein [Capilliphycus salinus ALCB114379]|uniref:helix-turn-helix domain-containing protein n=1 Tax=Capilliphycus salinus TaxID=2768948 RepID=UPI0039A71F71